MLIPVVPSGYPRSSIWDPLSYLFRFLRNRHQQIFISLKAGRGDAGERRSGPGAESVVEVRACPVASYPVVDPSVPLAFPFKVFDPVEEPIKLQFLKHNRWGLQIHIQ